MLTRVVKTVCVGARWSVRNALAAPRTAGGDQERTTRAEVMSARPKLSIVVLSYNRWAALERTLSTLLGDAVGRDAEIIVVDNASSDGSPVKVQKQFPGVRLVALRQNVGIAGFNEGVRATTGDAVLILDDDASPAAGVLDRALDLLSRRPDIAAISLHPKHPGTQESEWPFADAAQERERWPVMGCGNLIRRSAWDHVGGYEESFFLYRNDVDLALKLAGAGYGVYFDPAWTVWHDSPVAVGGKKSRRWFEMATRNWVWMCRRHGRGMEKWRGIVLGWLWAHRLAAWSPGAQAAVVRGAMAGLVGSRPAVPRACTRRGGLGALLRARLSRRA